MIVTLAFKAFAKAIPCLTPFLATSDPSVLKRILAYIRGLPCSSNIFPKKVILTYMVPIVAIRLRANQPARQAHFDHRNQCAVVFRYDSRPGFLGRGQDRPQGSCGRRRREHLAHGAVTPTGLLPGNRNCASPKLNHESYVS